MEYEVWTDTRHPDKPHLYIFSYYPSTAWRLELAASINAVMRMAMGGFWGLFSVGFFLGDERETAAIG